MKASIKDGVLTLTAPIAATAEKATITIEGAPWYIQKIDRTHLYGSFSPDDSRSWAFDYREFRGMPYCEDLRAWLIGDLEIDGKAYSGQGSYGGQA